MELDYELSENVYLKDVLWLLHHYVYPGEYEGRPSNEDIRKVSIDIIEKLEYPRIDDDGKITW